MPVIGLGTHQTFDVGLAPGIRETVGDVLRQFFDAGGSMIDSSPMYGRAEAVCGEVLVETGLQNRAFMVIAIVAPAPTNRSLKHA